MRSTSEDALKVVSWVTFTVDHSTTIVYGKWWQNDVAYSITIF
jgi:hypothetical protein